MTSCNAAITVLLEGDDCESAVLQTLTCIGVENHVGKKHCDVHGDVSWLDRAPGATPHQDPTPTYRAVELCAGDWGVEADNLRDPEWLVAEFPASHPDPQGAAEAEAARLNGNTDSSEWLHIYCRVAERARESERDEARAEADRYRKGLESIAEYSWGGGAPHDDLVFIAQRALDGGSA